MAVLALRSEAGSRFEKGLQPEQALEAQAVASKLLVELCGATFVPGTIDVGGDGVGGRKSKTIHLRDRRVSGLLGIEVPRATSRAVLEALGFGVADAPGGLDVTVPTWRRNDVTREADVIEEIARLSALDDLPATVPENRLARAGALSVAQQARRRAQDALVGTGLLEAVGWSFAHPDTAAKLGLPADDPRAQPIVLENPLSEDQSVLRTTLLGSLLDVASLNAARGNPPRGFFETGAVYLPRIDGAPTPVARRDGAIGHAAGRPGAQQLPAELDALAAIVPGDVFAAKGHLEALGRALRVDFEVQAAPQPFLHPGRTAVVRAGGEDVGWLGEVHPTVAGRWDLRQVSAFEVDLDRVIEHATAIPRFEDLTSFPELRQDLAVVVDAAIPAADVLAVVRAAGGKRLARAEVFDVYTGEQIAAGRKSLALALAFRAPDRTLSDEDVAPWREKIVKRLADELQGELRG
jgi:phenylalanyl-tRNA synthetase beta chain